MIGLAPTHIALKEEGGVTAVDFNVGKSDRSEMKVTGKRKRVCQLGFDNFVPQLTARTESLIFQLHSALRRSDLNEKIYLAILAEKLIVSSSIVNECED